MNYHRRSPAYVVGVDETWLEDVAVGVHGAEAPHGARTLSVEGTQHWVVSTPHHYSDLARRAVLEQLAHLAY